MKKLAALVLALFLTTGMAFADTPKDADPKPAKAANPAKPKATTKAEKSDSAIAAEIEELRQALQSQQEQLQLLKEELAKRDRQIDEAREAAAAANARAAEASTKAAEAANSSAEVKSTAVTLNTAVSDLKASNEALKTTIAAASGSPSPAAVTVQGSQEPGASPLQLKVGDASITPVGFMDLTGVWRSRNGGSGIGTNFAGIPYGNTPFQSNLNEFRFSMQNSRVGFRVDADVKGSHIIGYMESDFLGNNPPNVAVSSNSNTMRSRLYWADVRKGAWEILGGQTWSLATPNRSGVSPLPGDVFFSDNMDVNYQLGMVWGRIPEFRVAYHFPDDKAAFAVALASPDQYIGGTNGSAGVTLPACCANYAGGQFDNGTTTLGPPNRGPDVIAKFVVDPSKRFHGEIGGIARFFQAYNQSTATHFSATGGAGFVNLDVGVFGGLRLLSHNYWSDGGGRYIFGQAPDLIARADGSLSLVHASSTVDGFEFTHANSTFFGYYGLVYIQRNVAIDNSGCNTGWGFGPSAAGLTGCASVQSGQNRTIQEGTGGFIQNFWKNPRYGTLSMIGQFSYLTRDPWAVATGQPKNAHAGMAWLDLRYTLPGSAPTLGKP